MIECAETQHFDQPSWKSLGRRYTWTVKASLTQQKLLPEQNSQEWKLDKIANAKHFMCKLCRSLKRPLRSLLIKVDSKYRFLTKRSPFGKSWCEFEKAQQNQLKRSLTCNSISVLRPLKEDPQGSQWRSKRGSPRIQMKIDKRMLEDPAENYQEDPRGSRW